MPMPSAYRRRIEALEAVLGDGVCPPEGCGRCQALALLADIRKEPRPACDGRPGSMADGLREFTFEERRALTAALDEERERRKALTTPVEGGSATVD